MRILRKSETVETTRVVDTCNFDHIRTPGTYVENRWGTLFRMPKEALPTKNHRSSKRVAREWWPVTRLSDDPYVPVAKARRIGAELGLQISF
jgi:hypothetical protein